MKDFSAKPFLRWAGGKRWLASHLVRSISCEDFHQYHEPFLGCGALFFSLLPQGETFLSDVNIELINTYIAVRDQPNAIIEALKTFENTAECYYKIRATNYEDTIEKAARFIYLNQTSYNGLYRVNLKGEYNVPFGYRKKDFLDADTILSASKALSNASLTHGDFSNNRRKIQKGDLVYLDPPYTVTHNDNGFIKYNEHLFSKADFIRLSEYIDFIRSVGAYYILSNAAHPQVKEIFNKNEAIYLVKRASLIGGKNAYRGTTEEYLFTNMTKEILNEGIDYVRIG